MLPTTYIDIPDKHLAFLPKTRSLTKTQLNSKVHGQSQHLTLTLVNRHVLAIKYPYIPDFPNRHTMESLFHALGTGFQQLKG